MTPDQLKSLVRTVPDFPEAGIQFRDITTLLGHGEGLRATIAHLAERVTADQAQAVAGLEARGFIFGAAVAASLGVGFIPIRKPGKLPVETLSEDYALEYGTDRLELDPSGIADAMPVAIVDDLVATGGTALAASKLLERAGARLTGAHFVIDLPDIGGAARLRDANISVTSIMEFAGD